MKLVHLLLLSTLCQVAHASIEDDIAAAAQAYRNKDLAKLERYALALRETPLEVYASYYLLSLNLKQTDTETIQRFLNRSDNTAVIEQLRIEWLKQLGDTQRWDLFSNEYAAFTGKPDPELNCYQLQARWFKQDKTALEEARRLWFTGSAMPNSCGPIFNAAYSSGVISDYDVLQRIRLALENNNVSLALALNERLSSPLLLPLKLFKQAEKSPSKYIKSLNASKLSTVGERAIALYTFQRLIKDSVDQAYEHWQNVQHHFPSNERQYFYLLLAHEAARDHDRRALGWFNHGNTKFANTEQLAWWVRSALRSQNWTEVLKAINAMTPSQQKDETWRYWKARALKATGNIAEANQIFASLSTETSFYGQLANDELADKPALTNQSRNYKASNADIEAIEQQPAAQRMILLYRAEMRREASREWSWFLRTLDDRQLIAAAEVAKRQQMYDRSIAAAGLTRNTHDFSLRYPAPYRSTLHRHILNNDLDEAWVYGLMRQESRFALQAKSSVGARGVMQIMPDTGRWVAKKIGLSNYNDEMLYDSDINMQLGTYYMRHVYEQLDDNIVLATAAYNAGPGRAKRWRAYERLEGAIYAETIPFAETRDYVKKVLGNAVFYSEQFKMPMKSLKQRMGVVPAKQADD